VINMVNLVVFYFFFWWLTQVIYKITSLDQCDCPIKTYVRRIKHKRLGDFLSDLVDCELCMESHLAFFMCLPFVCWMQDFRLIILGYSAAGFNNIIKRIISNDE